jgi:hypothetical protein
MVLLALIINCFELQTYFIYSQPTLEWIKYYPDTNTFSSDGAILTVDDSGNVYTTGHSVIGTQNFYTTIKYNTSGVQQWVTNFFGDTAGGRFPHDIAVDKQSNVYVTGYAYTISTNYFDFCTVKYNSNGVQQWVRYYDNPTHNIDQARKIAIDNTGNIYVSGFSDLCPFSCGIYTTIKYSTNGDQIWSRTYGNGIGSCDLGDMKIDNDCNVYITGKNQYDAVTIKYDSSGNQQWVNTFHNSVNSTIAKSMVLDKNNNVIITGQSANGDRITSFTFKYSSSGVQQWAKIIAPTSLDTDSYSSNSVVADKDGNIYISGLYKHNAPTPMKYFLIKYSYSGDTIWSFQSLDSATPPNSYMDIDNDNNIYVAGTKSVYLNPFYQNQIVIFKFDTSGTLKWKEVTNFPYSIGTNNLILDKYLSIYLSGGSHSSIATLKYSQITGIITKKEILPKTHFLYQNYPNPFNPTTKIRFDIGPSLISQFRKEWTIILKIYDVLGRELETLVNQKLNTGTYEIEWNASIYASGIYFYQLKIGDFIETKKLILVK